MSLAVCNSVRSVGLDGWVAGMLACQDAQTDKDTLARRAANGQGVYLCFFLFSISAAVLQRSGPTA